MLLFKILTFVLGIYFPPAAFILNNIFWIAIVGVAIYFYFKFKGSKKKEEPSIIDYIEEQPKPKKPKRIKRTVSDITKPEKKKSEMDLLFDIIDEESK